MTAPLTLALDASTYAGTVALSCGADVLAACDVPMRNPGRETLLPAVADLMQRSGTAIGDVERIACGSGPGSFTGLRIAASIAKALAFGARASDGEGIPFYGVSSLLLIVAGNDVARRPGRYVAVLDALRGDAFTAVFEVGEQLDIVEIEPMAVQAREDIDDYAARFGARLVGPDQPDRLAPHARGVARVHAMLDEAPPADLASWEPNYGRAAEAQVRWEKAHGRPLRSR
ncbi:MAG TPA: tRNA (adenosine(37)-N6)-threonylcarbamoyltransferase complex dimerization subunit type 1 TsaB [Gemmatimonadaceae bacterium]|nr:tRNA (adenosine(37)-N6)-threonylcarbamoyltransferase complex dimerization subunit type 1 TsaB [Gemmatimonadaceae bacterium]